MRTMRSVLHQFMESIRLSVRTMCFVLIQSLEGVSRKLPVMVSGCDFVCTFVYIGVYVVMYTWGWQE